MNVHGTSFESDSRAAAMADRERVSLWELEQLVHAVDPAAILVPPRILRRVIKQDARLTGFGLRIPHRKSYVLSRDRLLAVVEPWELDMPPGSELAETVILVARPTSEQFDELPRPAILTRMWRLLFHARVHATLEARLRAGQLGPAEIADRLRDIGTTEFEEVRSVLKAEDFLLHPTDDTATYIEFAAVYLELHYFAPELVATYFPGTTNHPFLDDIFFKDVDGGALFDATRLPGAQLEATLHEQRPSVVAEAAARDAQPAQTDTALAPEAERSAKAGNLVRSAFLRQRTARAARGTEAVQAAAAARSDMAKLARRLQRALGATAAEGEGWAQVMVALIERSVESRWSAAGRMLYDLQRVCVDHERGIYTLHLWGWIKSRGRLPLRRWLPGQRFVMISKHLRSAQRRMPAIDLPADAHARLAALLEGAARSADEAVRARFRPAIIEALDAVQLVPRNLPERVARGKLVEELLDQIVDRGFLSMGDLRDALSRNNLKLPDLSSPRQLIEGDQLLAADRILVEQMDGVYHRGEVYLRVPQIVSSVAFGTRVGRLLTRFIAIPFGGAFLIIEGMQHLFTLVYGEESSPIDLPRTPSVFLLGFLLLGFIYYERFRQISMTALRLVGIGAQRLLVELPRRLLAWDWLRELLSSRWFRAAGRYLLKPIVFTGLILLLVGAFGRSLTISGTVALFLAANLLLNSRIGRNVDEVVMDWIAGEWHRFRIHVVASLVRFILDVFNRILENLEQMLYAVDEWLRFRSGERRSLVAVKAVLGVVWMVVHYVIRFCVTLLIEPQVNPIKHFPVVTVSHKILLPFAYVFIGSLEPLLDKAWATTVGTTIVLVLPGVFGFLVWELKENWRLYSANRPRHLAPVTVGRHGESVLQLMKPGFRSGTLPKAFNRLRRGHRRALGGASWKAASRQFGVLHHVADGLRRFAQRELAKLLEQSHGWHGLEINAGEVQLATNRILIELYCPALSEQSLWIAFEGRSGWLVASISQRGWLDRLSFEQRTTLASALVGFYKMAGVDLVREQIELRTVGDVANYEIGEQGLVLWRIDRRQEVMPLYEWDGATPARTKPAASGGQSQIEPKKLVFGRSRLSWRRWVTAWDADQLGSGGTQQVIDGRALLPHGV